MARIAFHTFGVLRAPYGDATVQGFIDRVPTVFAAADRADGFLLRLPDRTPEERQCHPHFYDPRVHPDVALTVSVWRDLESVYAYAYHGVHREALQKRTEWFVPPQWPTYVAWWLDDETLPTHIEAIARIERLHDHGPTPDAFTFRAPFDAAGQPTHLRVTVDR